MGRRLLLYKAGIPRLFLYIHRDNQLRGKKDEESDFVNTREMIKEDIVNFFKRITNVFKIRRKRWKKLN